MFRYFTNQVTQAYMVLMANLTKLLGALDYQDANSIIPELKEILLLEVDLIKVIFYNASLQHLFNKLGYVVLLNQFINLYIPLSRNVISKGHEK